MLNYETILSNYDDKLTLMQWLKKVEAALENASATAFHVNNRGNATLTFSIDFADGTSIESDEFVLQQGESVASARIVNGQLILTLTNGDELNAGNILNGNLNLNGNLVVSNNIEAEFLNVRDTATLESAEITGSASVGGGLDVAGDITGGSIIENMSATYTFTPDATLSANGFTLAFVGVVKNGNKLTFAVAGSFKGNGGSVPAQGNPNLGVFRIPDNVASKLYDIGVAGGALDVRQVVFMKDATTSVIKYARITKSTTGGYGYLTPQFFGMNSTFASNTLYAFRYEVTFLLCDSMI